MLKMLQDFSSGQQAAVSKDKSINALQDYNRFINQDYSPQDAYLKVISNLTDKDLPKPEKLPMPATLNLTDMKQIIIKILILLKKLLKVK